MKRNGRHTWANKSRHSSNEQQEMAQSLCPKGKQRFLTGMHHIRYRNLVVELQHPVAGYWDTESVSSGSEAVPAMSVADLGALRPDGRRQDPTLAHGPSSSHRATLDSAGAVEGDYSTLLASPRARQSILGTVDPRTQQPGAGRYSKG